MYNFGIRWRIWIYLIVLELQVGPKTGEKLGGLVNTNFTRAAVEKQGHLLFEAHQVFSGRVYSASANLSASLLTSC